ncbi:CBM96 family carbohydrate-binding protein [Humisphaera borealis]|uniref:DNRLRE domain-containing protein n=1 Tax=Humisphaera borealis TaxID=2807512 RepID=A0A7M2WYV3_9BACT|nr:DNRLRE domain-containing protein [Humisphaera borealis]QOV90707.1 DNRLRE domain-containing protein [Humisphaera borealis]
MTWASDSGVTDVRIRRSLVGPLGPSVFTFSDLPAAGEYVDSSIEAGQTYDYTIYRRTSDGNFNPSDLLRLTMPGLASPVDDANVGIARFPNDLTSYKGYCYFTSGVSVPGLWRSDGTASGTKLVVLLDPVKGVTPAELTVAGNLLYFRTGDSSVGQYLWSSDGTDTGTRIVRQLAPPGTSDTYVEYSDFIAAGDRLFFSSTPDPFSETRTLWTSDGTEGGTKPIEDVSLYVGPYQGPGTASPGKPSPIVSGSTLCFVGTTPAGGVELWRTDGSPSGTSVVADLSTGPESTQITALTIINGTVYFGVGGGSAGLYATDGTAAGTRLVCTSPTGGPTVIAGTGLGPLAGKVYFGTAGNALYEVDAGGGSAVLRLGGVRTDQIVGLGGRLIAALDGSLVTITPDIVSTLSALKPIAQPSLFKRVLYRVGDKVYFIDDTRLYRTDGTSAGTIFVANGAPVFAELGGRLAEVNGSLFYKATDVNGSNDQLWCVSGTAPIAPDEVRAIADPSTPVAALSARYMPAVGTGALPAATRVQVSWKDRASTETGFYVERSTSPDFSGPTSNVWVNANAQAWTDPAAPTTAYYRVASMNAAGVSPPSQVVAVTAPASISGRVGQDTDGNGILAPSEPGLANTQVFLDLNGNSIRDGLDPVVTTLATGAYSFANLAPGGYRIGVVTPAGWSPSNNISIQRTISVAAGQNFSADVLIRRSPSIALRASADAYVRDGSYAATNFGSASELHVRKNTIAGNSREAYLRFDLTTVGPSSGLTSAKVRVAGKLSQALASGVSIGLFAVSSATWTESGLKWSNKPATSATALATRTISATGATWIEFDVTNYVRQQKAAGVVTVNFAIKAIAAATPWVTIVSDEATANRPELLVQQSQTTTLPPPVSPPPTSPPPISPPPTTTGATKIKFQPASAPTVAGYMVDTGATYGTRNGRTYGWTISHSDAVVDRNKNTNQLLDTNVGVKAGARWEVAVPNGTYTVRVGIGDSGASSQNNVWIESANLFNYVALTANTFSSKSITVTVADGKLSLGVGGAATGVTRINFIEIT